MNDMEMVIFGLISSSGTARSLAFEALAKAKVGNFEEAITRLDEATKHLGDAHNIQTSLIQNEASDNKTELSLLLIHAQDHLMTSMLAKDLISQMVPMEQRLRALEER